MTLSYRLERAGPIHVLCDVPGPGRHPATTAEIELFAEVERLRNALMDLVAECKAYGHTPVSNYHFQGAVLRRAQEALEEEG